MAAPSRHTSPGTAVSNPCVDEEACTPILIEYELAQERRKKELHDRVELDFKRSGIVLDARVSAGFKGVSAAAADTTVGKSRQKGRSAQ
jgi:hypothetical protein